MFHESKCGEISQFVSMFFGMELVPAYDFYTFELLASAPEYSIEDAPYLGATAIVTCEGRPWDVMRENGLVYNLNTGLVVPIETITQAVVFQKAGHYYLSNGLILPGSIQNDGTRITDYTAYYSFDTGRFKYSEVLSD